MKLLRLLLAATSCILVAPPVLAQSRSTAVEICKAAVVARGLGNKGFDGVDASRSGNDWNVRGYAKTVDKGRASFDCKLEGRRVASLSIDDSDRRGDGDRDRRGDRESGLDRVVLCESDNRQRNTCRMNTRGGVRMVEQTSDTTCRQGKNWGFTSGSVWVDKGCSARFEAAGRR